MQIDFLANHRHHIPALAAWHHQMWGHLDPGATLQKRIDRLTSHGGQLAMPTTVIAFDARGLLGSASLVQNDLRSHPQLTPFLASVYVGEEFRRQGIASTLVARIVVEAQRLGVARIYLITPDQQALYARLGWEEVDEVLYRGELVTLMAVELS
ncbi:MAG: GNAT family N-acetyltransferase [Caldilineaceae bacterium]